MKRDGIEHIGQPDHRTACGQGGEARSTKGDLMRKSAIALLLLAAAAGARTAVVDIQWSGDGRFSHATTVAAGNFVEVCGNLPAQVIVRWEFEASSALDFNVHYHAGKDVVFPSKLSAVTNAKDTLDTKIEQAYCWMWSNKTSLPVTLSVRLQR